MLLALSLLLLLAPAPPGQASDDRTLYQWTFDDQDAPGAWSANDQVRNLRAEDGALRFRCAGGDPILVYARPFEFTASSHQALEIRMKADRAGTFEVFWTGTTEGPYGGFSGEKRTAFSVSGDGQWRTYRLYPFWQREGRIVKIRLDPYDGADFAIQSIRVADFSKPAATRPRWSFTGDSAGWSVQPGCRAAASAAGLAATLERPDGLLIAPPLDLDTESLPYVTLSVSTRNARRAILVYATDASYGAHEVAVSLVPDGRRRTVNVDMVSSPGWAGRLRAIGIRPGSQEGDRLTLHSLALGSAPGGPAALHLQWFGLDDALPRFGGPLRVTARLANHGGQTLKSVRFDLTVRGLPASWRQALPPRAVESLGFGEERELSWTATPRTPRFTLELRSPQLPGGVVRREYNLPRAGARAAYVPPPQPVRPDIEVGVYYFPGWRTSGQWAPIMRFPERKPALGWYREGEPEVIDWQIKWAVEHGITFFAYDWYWNKGARILEHGLHDGYLKSRYRHLLKFCLLWANHNPPNTSSLEDCIAVSRYWIEHYFRLPEHLTIDGKPVMIIFQPSRFREDMGLETTRRALEAMREECRKAGLKGLYLIACVGGTGDAAAALEEGYDAITCYNWAGINMAGSERWSPFARLIEGYRNQWNSLLESCPLPLMTPLSGGWDSRPWHGDAALVRSDRTPALFEQHLRDAKRLIESRPGRALPAILIEAWNEWGEGSYIEPHREYGFGYLDAIRRVFTKGPEPHRDLVPADVRRPLLEVTPADPSRVDWRFQRDPEGWEGTMNTTHPRVADGALMVETTSDDNALYSPPLQVRAERFRRVVVRARLTAPPGMPAEDSAQLFWATRTAPTSEAASVRVPVRLDGQWREIAFEVGSNPRWRGVIIQLRLDPCNRTGVKVEVASIRLE